MFVVLLSASCSNANSSVDFLGYQSEYTEGLSRNTHHKDLLLDSVRPRRPSRLLMALTLHGCSLGGRWRVYEETTRKFEFVYTFDDVCRALTPQALDVLSTAMQSLSIQAGTVGMWTMMF